MDENPYAAPKASPEPEPPQRAVPLAGRWSRLGAALLDGGLLIVLQLAFLIVTGRWRHFFSENLRSGMFAVTRDDLIWAIAGIVVFLAINWSLLGRGQTIGKRLLGIQIRNMDGSIPTRGQLILKRILPWWILSCIPVIGGVVVLTDSLCIFLEGNRTLHDEFAGTEVTEVIAPSV